MWVGTVIGAGGDAVTGILLLGGYASQERWLSLGLMFAGFIGLKLSTH
ncbi:hypothetical protein J4U51_24585 [Escherichia coli]